MAGKESTTSLNNRTLTQADFTTNEKVVACLAELKNQFYFPLGGAALTDTSAAASKRPFIVSDVMDEHGNQYVNLVQKGGGVLGIALVGYTYVLEQMGIRFLRLAGTSAGAINTGMMTAINRKEDTKSETIVEKLCQLNFFSLVDGPPVAKWIIKKFISQSDFLPMVKRWLIGTVLCFVLLIIADFVCLGMSHSAEWAGCLCLPLFIATALYIIGLGIGAAYIASLMKKLKNSGYGINPGDYLYDWIKEHFQENGVNTVSDLNRKAEQPIPGVRLRPGVQNEAGITGLNGDVTFITSELVTENKLQFPAMCKLFRKPADIDTLQPAGFVRASMSIPVFFESYYIDNIPCDDKDIRALWLEMLDENDPPSVARFVDGGILSNFPINLFYNKDIKVPRLPTFGIDLDDSKPDDSTKHAESWSLGGYFGRMFNTIRFYYDKDFLIKNRVMQQGVGKVPLSEYNWLNFFLSNEEKLGMFIAGAEAAKNFLLTFDWESYKGDRAALPAMLAGKK